MTDVNDGWGIESVAQAIVGYMFNSIGLIQNYASILGEYNTETNCNVRSR